MLALLTKIIVLTALLFTTSSFGQSRRSSRGEAASDGTVISVTANRSDAKTDPIRVENLFLYENAIEQRIGRCVVASGTQISVRAKLWQH